MLSAPGGGPIRYANWRSRVWVPACKSGDLEGLGFHDLRRLNASALANLGIDVKAVSGLAMEARATCTGMSIYFPQGPRRLSGTTAIPSGRR